MSEQVAEVLAVIRAHIPRDRYDDGESVGTYCGCGEWEGDYFADGEAGPFDDHLAEALAPLIAERERAAAERALREAAESIERELICCPGEKADPRHAICHWGMAARWLVMERIPERDA